jgi:hypothetical protein
MAYTKPNTFANGTALTAADVQGNTDALRVYLHEGISGADLLAGKFVDRRHVQQPGYNAITGVQHGVSGHQGGQWSGGSTVRVTFSTSALTGRRYTGAQRWEQVPGTSFQVDVRGASTVLFHWFIEVEAGPDDGSRGPGTDERYVWFAPYVGNTSLIVPTAGQEVVNNYNGWENGTANAYGADQPYTYLGYGAHNGVYLDTTTGPTRYTIGLGTLSYIERVSVLNWGVAIEVTYD